MEKSIFVLSLVVAFALNTQSIAAEIASPKKVQVTIAKVSDGDTVKAALNNQYVSIRLADIDCPESRTNDKSLRQAKKMNISPEEVKKYGKEAQQELKRLLSFHEEHIYFEETPDKVCRGETRHVGILWADDINVNEYMLEKTKCVSFSCSE